MEKMKGWIWMAWILGITALIGLGMSTGIPSYGFCENKDPINVVVFSSVNLPSGISPGEIFAKGLLDQWDWFDPLWFEDDCGQDYSAVKHGWWFDRWHIRIENLDSKTAYANVHYDYNLWKLLNHDSRHCEDSEDKLRSEVDGAKVCLSSSCYLIKYKGEYLYLGNQQSGCRDGYASVYQIIPA